MCCATCFSLRVWRSRRRGQPGSWQSWNCPSSCRSTLFCSSWIGGGSCSTLSATTSCCREQYPKSTPTWTIRQPQAATSSHSHKSSSTISWTLSASAEKQVDWLVHPKAASFLISLLRKRSATGTTDEQPKVIGLWRTAPVIYHDGLPTVSPSWLSCGNLCLLRIHF